jgi:hypothetical protein
MSSSSDAKNENYTYIIKPQFIVYSRALQKRHGKKRHKVANKAWKQVQWIKYMN